MFDDFVALRNSSDNGKAWKCLSSCAIRNVLGHDAHATEVVMHESQRWAAANAVNCNTINEVTRFGLNVSANAAAEEAKIGGRQGWKANPGNVDANFYDFAFLD